MYDWTDREKEWNTIRVKHRKLKIEQCSVESTAQRNSAVENKDKPKNNKRRHKNKSSKSDLKEDTDARDPQQSALFIALAPTDAVSIDSREYYKLLSAAASAPLSEHINRGFS